MVSYLPKVTIDKKKKKSLAGFDTANLNKLF